MRCEAAVGDKQKYRDNGGAWSSSFTPFSNYFFGIKQIWRKDQKPKTNSATDSRDCELAASPCSRTVKRHQEFRQSTFLFRRPRTGGHALWRAHTRAPSSMPSQQCRKRRRSPTPAAAAAAVLVCSILAAGGDSFAITSHHAAAGATAAAARRLSLKGAHDLSSRTTTIGSGAKETAFAWSGGVAMARSSSLRAYGARSAAVEEGSSAATTTMMSAGKPGKGSSKTKPPSLPQVGVDVSYSA